MANFKPQARFITEDSNRDYHNGVRKSREITNVFSTYANLKKRLKAMLNASFDEVVYVSRSRRGEWGEWAETWILVNGKPAIVKQGWM
jgi:hypothetical protein